MLDVSQDVVELTAALVDIASESLAEQQIADEVESVLQRLNHLTVVRNGNTLVARTELGRADRVVIAGHLDTVPENGNFPSRRTADILWGLGSCDMKGGVAVALKLAAELPAPTRDITFVFYDGEEIAAIHNGLGRVARETPALLAADFAILMEPSNAAIEAGCQGTMRVEVSTVGERAHSARSWTGHNAIHDLAPIFATLVDYVPRNVEIDGLTYREGLNAVGVSGGVSGNVIPDLATVTINYRFAPDRTEAEALAHLEEVFAGHELVVTDSAPGAVPGLAKPAAAAFIEAVNRPVAPKFGWTDVSKFTQLGVPAVNYGPGDPLFAHKADEHVRIDEIVDVYERMVTWLTA